VVDSGHWECPVVSRCGPVRAEGEDVFGGHGCADRGEAFWGPPDRGYLGVKLTPIGGGVTAQVSDGNLWCGPALLSDSDPGETWVRRSFFTSLGDTIVEASMAAPRPSTFSSTQAVDAGLTLWRPDRAAPPAGAGGLQVPDAGPIDPGKAVLLNGPAQFPSGSYLTAPRDGRLFTPDLSLTLTGLGTVPKAGSGADAVVPPSGQELRAAIFTVTRPAGAGFGNGTAAVIAGGVRTPITNWSSIRDAGTLLVSVPPGTTDLQLEVTSRERCRPSPSSPAIGHLADRWCPIAGAARSTRIRPSLCGSPCQRVLR
jgi:hypothetical protein